MDSNIDNIFKEKISSVDNKPMDWNKNKTWELIQSRKNNHILKRFMKYAAVSALIVSALITMQKISNQDRKQQEILSREEKYERLKIIEQRLSNENGTPTICYTCFNPYLKTGTKPVANGFRVDIFYQ